MGVQIDEAGRHDQSARVDLPLRCRASQAADSDDAIAAHADVSRKPRIASAVDDVAVAYQQVVRRLLPFERRLPEQRCGEKRREKPAPKHLCHTPLINRMSIRSRRLGLAAHFGRDHAPGRLRTIGLEHPSLALVHAGAFHPRESSEIEPFNLLEEMLEFVSNELDETAGRRQMHVGEDTYGPVAE